MTEVLPGLPAARDRTETGGTGGPRYRWGARS